MTFLAWAWAAGTWGVVTLMHSVGLRINHTPSLPIGIWRVSPLIKPLARDSVVSFCPPEIALFHAALRQGIIGNGSCEGGWEALLKPIVALPGDLVEVKDTGVAVNGATVPHSARIAFLDGAIPLGAYAVQEEEVWVIASSHPRSFDSRYFGPIPIENIEGLAEPIFVWPRP